jgi:hypothetical protein
MTSKFNSGGRFVCYAAGDSVSELTAQKICASVVEESADIEAYEVHEREQQNDAKTAFFGVQNDGLIRKAPAADEQARLWELDLSFVPHAK